jgi:HK97 family phage portal protein
VNIVERVGAGLKAFSMVFTSGSRGWYSMTLGRTKYNYSGDVGDGTGNAILMSVIGWVCRTFPEAPIRVSRINSQGEIVPLPNHPLKKLLDTPNKFYSGEMLWRATLYDWQFGDAYWLKIRNAVNGRPVELWWIPRELIKAKWPDDGSEFISHYEYTPEGQVIEIPFEDIVHLRYGFDPKNMREGYSPVKALYRELFIDDESANYTASMVRNVGVPPVILAPKWDKDGNGPKMDQAAAEEVKSKFHALTTGDNRGSVMVMRGATEVTTLGFNPEQMNLRELRKVTEERVTSMYGIPAVVVGLGAGLDRSTFANFAEAREAAYESNIIPTQRLFIGELRTQLLPDFGDVETLAIDFDLSQVRVLQEDQNALHARALADLNGGGITLNEFREVVGLEPLDGEVGDVLYIPSGVTPTDPEEILAEPEPVSVVTELPPGETQDESGGRQLPPPSKMLPLRRRRAPVESSSPPGATAHS